ncbi:MAG: F0F1 ATP synthase subunit epsilon [Actinomycetota bacterium]
MRLAVIMPGSTVVDTPATRVLAPGSHGLFAILPRHVDYVAVLVEGLLTFEVADDAAAATERHVAVDGGVLVKQGDDVVVSTPDAVVGERLEDLENTVAEYFHARAEREHDARAALFRLESDIVQRMLELEESHG